MSNKVSIKDIKAAVKAKKQDTIKFTFGSGENSIEVEFKQMLSLAEESVFIDRVCNNSFDTNNNFLPEYKDILFSVTVMQMLSNITIPKSKNDNGVEMIDFAEYKKWDSHFHFVETIYSASMNDEDQYKFAGYVDHLEDMVNDKIEYIKEQNFNKSKLDELFTAITDAVNKQSSSFDGVDMKDVLNKIANMKLDNKTIIDEILKQSKKDNKDKVVDIKAAKK